MDSLVQQLVSITPHALKRPDYDNQVRKHASDFRLFFSQLRLLLSDNTEPSENELILPDAKLSLQAETSVHNPEALSSNVTQFPSDSKKRPNSLIITTSSPIKVRLTSSGDDDVPQTPDQPTIPNNPAFSGDSTESTDEDNIKRMIGTLMDTALLNLGSDFVLIPWPISAQECRLRSSGYLFLYFSFDK